MTYTQTKYKYNSYIVFANNAPSKAIGCNLTYSSSFAGSDETEIVNKLYTHFILALCGCSNYLVERSHNIKLHIHTLNVPQYFSQTHVV